MRRAGRGTGRRVALDSQPQEESAGKQLKEPAVANSAGRPIVRASSSRVEQPAVRASIARRDRDDDDIDSYRPSKWPRSAADIPLHSRGRASATPKKRGNVRATETSSGFQPLRCGVRTAIVNRKLQEAT